ncbi:MAG: LysM peptidoglycan-binding domain-containing protein [Oscillospiraceae bacterium]
MLIHIVRSGDTLSSIARRYGVAVSRIRLDNGLTEGQTLVIGQALIITLPAIVHTVVRGDTLSGVAAMYGVTVIELIQNNPNLIFDPVLRPGQQITITFQGGKIREISIKGYAYTHIQRQTLLRALPYLTYLAIFSYGFTESGELIPVNDTELISLAYQFNAAPVLVLSSIDENGGFSTQRASALFNDEALQELVLSHLVEVMTQKGYVGADMDFEYIAPEDAEAYQNFLRRASEYLGRYGFTMNVDLAPKTHPNQPGLLYEAHDYAAIGTIADTVLLMTYEWGYTFGPPMAVAPLNQVRDVVEYAVTEIPPYKILMGIPNYGYDWTLPYEQGVSRAENIGNQGAVQRAARYGANIQFDEIAQSPFFEYFADGRQHIVWFEDVRSIEAKLALTTEFDLLGVGYWNIMRPFNQNWAYIAARYGVRKIV